MTCCGKQKSILEVQVDEPKQLPLQEQLTKGVKIVVLGEMGTGKTSILHRWITNEFAHQNSTVGCAFSTKSVTFKSKIIRYEIWDAAGQERYRSLSSVYYRNAIVALLVYDVTRYETFNAVTDWVNELKANTSNNIMILIVGNKADLANEKQVDQEMVDHFIETANSNIIGFVESSALTGQGINEIFDKVSENLLIACGMENQS